MSLNLLEETRLSITAVAKRVGVNCSTVWRWVLSGVRGHRLESALLGGKRYTTESALGQFLAKINGEVPQAISPAAQRRAIEQDEKVCEEAGI